MNADRRALLLTAIREWVSIQPEENATPRMPAMEAELDRPSYAWIGTDAVNTPYYARTQGPTLFIEPLSTGGNVGGSASAQRGATTRTAATPRRNTPAWQLAGNKTHVPGTDTHRDVSRYQRI